MWWLRVAMTTKPEMALVKRDMVMMVYEVSGQDKEGVDTMRPLADLCLCVFSLVETGEFCGDGWSEVNGRCGQGVISLVKYPIQS